MCDWCSRWNMPLQSSPPPQECTLKHPAAGQSNLTGLPPTYEVRRNVMFSLCPPSGGGVPHLHLILPLVPCPFLGCTPVTDPRSGRGGGIPWWGYPLARDWVPPPPASSGWSVLHDRVPLARDGVPPPPTSSGWSVLHDGGTPGPGMGYLPRIGYARAGYASCGFPQEDFFVYECGLSVFRSSFRHNNSGCAITILTENFYQTNKSELKDLAAQQAAGHTIFFYVWK